MTDPLLSPRRQFRVLLFIANEENKTGIETILANSKIPFLHCSHIDELCQKAETDCSIVITCDQTIRQNGKNRLIARIKNRKNCSELPILLLASEQNPISHSDLEQAHIVILQQPLNPTAVKSSILAALRSRRIQLEINQLLSRKNRVLSSSNDWFLIVDRKWNVVFANQKFADACGFNPKSPSRQSLWELIPEFDNKI